MKYTHLFPFVIFLTGVVIFFAPFFFAGKLPIPADTIIGLYHPFRDLYAADYPNGIPYKNSLITDPVRQQYPWRERSIASLMDGRLPLWNPYSMAGIPLLGNFQSAPFYPFNILLFLLPFEIGWSVLIVLQPVLAGIFLYLYLRNLKLHSFAATLGAIVFAFCGFSVAWMEWGTIGHVGLWLPLVLLAIDKIVSSVKNRKVLLWSLLFTLSLVFSFFAGHLQTFFYLYLLSVVYFIVKWIQAGRKINLLILYVILNTCFLILTSIQWVPTLELINLSGRDVDQIGHWQKDGWFVPWQHLVQFVAPDFFGNPTTLNYWGVWNYGEFIGYIGIIPLILALYSLSFRKDKKTFFFGCVFFLSLAFSLPTILSKLPFIVNMPFISTAQPTRLMFLVDFSLAVLTALGFDFLLKTKKRKGIVYALTCVLVVIISLWSWTFINNQLVARQNLILPTILFIVSSVSIIAMLIVSKYRRVTLMIYIILVGITIFDLLRFAQKFTPFTDSQYLFPQTKTIEFLQNQKGNYRIMSIDQRILPPNFSVVYRLQTIDGYDPLYLRRFGELIASSERKRPDISAPFHFNRIITPVNYESKIMDLLGVKYLLSLTDVISPKLIKVFQEGETRVYENQEVMPRVFFVENISLAKDKQTAINILFQKGFDPRKQAVVELEEGGVSIPPPRWKVGKAEITRYDENNVVIHTENDGDGFLVLTDSFYPTWHATIDGIETKIYRTDYNFRGIIVTSGKHTVSFSASLF